MRPEQGLKEEKVSFFRTRLEVVEKLLEVSEDPISVTIREFSIQGITIILETHSGEMGRGPCSNQSA